MNEQLLEELTLYLDGEHPDRVAFEEKMRLDKELSERCREYQALSRVMQSLPAPDTHPAFATRVMAHLDDKPRLDWSGLSRAWQRALLTPAFVVLLGLALWFFQLGQETESPSTIQPVTNSAEAVVASAAQWESDEAVIEELALLLAQGVDAGSLVPYDGNGLFHPSEDALSQLFNGSVNDWEMDAGLYGTTHPFGLYDEMSTEDFNELQPYLLEDSYK